MKNVEFRLVEKTNSKIDDVTKYVLEDDEFGKNEVSIIRKKDKVVFCIPTQTNCRMGCTFCHLTGTTRPSRNLTSDWLSSVVDYLTEQTQLNKPLLISYMGVGEPLLSVPALTDSMWDIHSKYPNTRFGVSTMMPSLVAMQSIINWCVVNPQIKVKMHLSVHGVSNRGSIIKAGIGVSESIQSIQRFHGATNLPIEYHYTLVGGVNDSVEELMAFNGLVEGDGGTIKFLTLSETNEFQTTLLSNDTVESCFPRNIVEFYDPPGRDVGASCGMFDKNLYNNTDA